MKLLDLFDAPRYCPDDGERIEVVNDPEFDPKTGEPRDRWYWHCPRVSVELYAGGGSHVSQTGVAIIHRWGHGRPRWHKR